LAHEFPEQCGFEPDEPSLNRIVVEDQSGLQSPLDVSSSEVCPSCGNFMVPHGGGNCYFCQNCGQSEGGCG
jgi:ribosomal protein L32